MGYRRSLATDPSRQSPGLRVPLRSRCDRTDLVRPVPLLTTSLKAMTNYRMTNDELNQKEKIRKRGSSTRGACHPDSVTPSSFDIRALSFLRHSAFGIRPF